MSAMNVLKRSILGLSAIGLVVLAVASPASAASPWWHLTSGSLPAKLQPGLAKEGVVEIIAEPGSAFELRVNGSEVGLFEAAPYEFGGSFPQATAANVQSALEGAYGAGNVVVTGGPGGSAPLVIKTGYHPVEPVQIGQTLGTVEAKLLSQARPDGEILLTAANLGDAAVDASKTPVTITDKLPAGLTAVFINSTAGEGPFETGLVGCSLGSLTCTFTGTLTPYRHIKISIGVVASGSSEEDNHVSVSGGGTVGAATDRPVVVGSEPASVGVENYELAPENEGGTPDTQAGSHPFQLTTTLTLNQKFEQRSEGSLRPEPVALTKDLNFKLPPGLIGNPVPLPRCAIAEFLSSIEEQFEGASGCPTKTAVGVARVLVDDPGIGSIIDFLVPVFNLEPSTGEPARFGFRILTTPVYLDTSLRTGGDYGVTVSVDNIAQTVGFLSNELTFWGVPNDPRHDNSRGYGCLMEAMKLPHTIPCNPAGDKNPPPFLVLPTSCGGPLQTTVEADSWNEPEPAGLQPSFPGAPMQALDGCNRLQFSPSIKVTPDGNAGSTPTGLTVDEHVPQESTLVASGLAESSVKGLSVTLPQGVALNPAAADGLQACSESQVGLQIYQAPTCPEASKVATVTIRTPLLSEPLEGEAYLAVQNQNPFGSLVALYIYAEDPTVGVHVKATGEVLEDPVTGQLTAHFEHDPVFEGNSISTQFLPELPFEDVELHFFGGNRAPLGTPALCGSYKTTGTFTPWSGNPTTGSSSTFDITSGPNGSPCASPLPFNPSLTTGSTNIQAGAFTPFTMTMSREDGQQNLKAVQLKMPPGLLGTLSSVKLCGEAEANAGTCGPESLIGETIVSVGLGGNPFSVKGGKVYITGPYHGASFGLSIVNPAKAGPFDLGQVIVRAKIEVDPITSALTITTDDSGPYSIPQILGGIPLQIQHINVTINRPSFTFNPTNCTPTAITGSLTSSEGAVGALSVPFQVTNCATLAFKPQFKVSTAGKTSRTKGASLDVKLSYPKAAWGSQANIKSVKVNLPKQLPSRLTTLQKACPDNVFEANPASCPAASRIGTATATTPIIPVALSGPAYFVSHGGLKFPELVIVLSGYGVTVQLHGETFISTKGITSSTFRAIPDVPIGSFELKLPQGPFSALGANANLCKVKGGLKMPTAFTAQNGLVIKQSTPVGVTGCPKPKKAKKPKKK